MNALNPKVIQIMCVCGVDGQGFMPIIKLKMKTLGTCYGYENPLLANLTLKHDRKFKFSLVRFSCDESTINLLRIDLKWSPLHDYHEF